MMSFSEQWKNFVACASTLLILYALIEVIILISVIQISTTFRTLECDRYASTRNTMNSNLPSYDEALKLKYLPETPPPPTYDDIKKINLY